MTVIVLLILAGISLKILLGNDGLLSKTRRAKEEAAKTSAVEDVQLSWGLAETRYQTRTGEDNNKAKSEYFTRENISSNLNDGTIPEELNSFVFNEKGISKVLYENKNKERYIVEVNSNGEARVVENSDINGKDEFVATNHTVMLSQGGNYQITSSSELKWNSSDSKIASIETEGSKVIISGVSAGNTIITGKNENDTIVVECNIKVSDSNAGTFKWKKYNANKQSVYSIDSPEAESISWAYPNYSVTYSSTFGFCVGNGYFYSKGNSTTNWTCLYSCHKNGWWNKVAFLGNTKNTLSSSRSVYLLQALRSQASASSSGNSGWGSVWKISSYLAGETCTKGSDTGEIVESSNPLDYPSNGYKKVDDKDYWFEMVTQ